MIGYWNKTSVKRVHGKCVSVNVVKVNANVNVNVNVKDDVHIYISVSVYCLNKIKFQDQYESSVS